MRSLSLIVMLWGLGLSVAWGVAPATDPASFEKVLRERCSTCHTRERIDVARRQGGDVTAITGKMLSHGARLSQQEQQVLGTFWGSPLKEKAVKENKPAAGKNDEVRAIIENRCLRCHTRERIDLALAQKLPFASVEAMMARRGVVLTSRENEVLKVFWGNPLTK